MLKVVRPHPSPLPQGRERGGACLTIPARLFAFVALGDTARSARTTAHVRLQPTRRMVLPLLGERAGVRADNLQHLQLRRSAIFVETGLPMKPTSPGGATCSRRCRSYGAWSLGFGALLQLCRPSGADAAHSLNRTMLKPRPVNGSAEQCSARFLQEGSTKVI